MPVKDMLKDSNIPTMAVNKWGKDHQLLVMVEEMSEAISAIAQLVNRKRDKEQEVIDELGDVCLMIEQAKVIYGGRLTSATNRSLVKLHSHIKGDSNG